MKLPRARKKQKYKLQMERIYRETKIMTYVKFFFNVLLVFWQDYKLNDLSEWKYWIVYSLEYSINFGVDGQNIKTPKLY